jgi:GNAT superfamily N-acetyltransferase
VDIEKGDRIVPIMEGADLGTSIVPPLKRIAKPPVPLLPFAECYYETDIPMTDMLVKLYALPDVNPLLTALNQKGLEIRRPHPSERYVLAEWVRQHFHEPWAVGCEVALENKPVSCYIAVEKRQDHVPSDDPYDLPEEVLVGFACYDVDSKGMFGAMGVKEDRRGQGTGTALLLACLHAMKEEGYAYAVIGWVASVDFYANAAGATVIPDSEPGIFRGKLVGSV